jgi:hypothetical protein
MTRIAGVTAVGIVLFGSLSLHDLIAQTPAAEAGSGSGSFQ